jgi:hypothetical protein
VTVVREQVTSGRMLQNLNFHVGCALAGMRTQPCCVVVSQVTLDSKEVTLLRSASNLVGGWMGGRLVQVKATPASQRSPELQLVRKQQPRLCIRHYVGSKQDCTM